MIDRSMPDIYELYDAAGKIEDLQRRDAFIQSHCHDNPELGKQLREMLAAREEAEAFFEKTCWDNSATLPDHEQLLGRVGRFRLDRLAGRGGMGSVFLGYDELLHRPVALKFPRLDTLGNPELLEQFLREARFAAQLRHPNLVDIYEVGVWGNACFIASRWCEGGDLAVWLTKHPGPQDPIWSASLVKVVAGAVSYCHQQGVVHLDIKPGNIILWSDPMGNSSVIVSTHEHSEKAAAFSPMLTDFGIARLIEQGSTATQSSLLLGTPLYMAPEQAGCKREQIGPASDIFALGVILYEMLYGVRPFEGESAIAVIDRIRSAETLSMPRSSTVPNDLKTICRRCLEYRPVDRYPSADALVEDLNRYLAGEPIHARPLNHAHRIWRWLKRPERIVQAGITSLVIQFLIVFYLTAVALTISAGGASMIKMPLVDLVREIAVLIIFLHGPGIAAAWLTVHQKAAGVWVGLILSLLTGLPILHVLLTGESHIELYRDQPLATFLIHFLLFCAITIQTAAYTASLPALHTRISGAKYHRHTR